MTISKDQWVEMGFKEITYDKATQLTASILSEGDMKGKSLWGAFNGVTYYTNHEMYARDRDKTLFFGQGSKINNIALGYLSGKAIS
jgi:hypothetical protein